MALARWSAGQSCCDHFIFCVSRPFAVTVHQRCMPSSSTDSMSYGGLSRGNDMQMCGALSTYLRLLVQYACSKGFRLCPCTPSFPDNAALTALYGEGKAVTVPFLTSLSFWVTAIVTTLLYITPQFLTYWGVPPTSCTHHLQDISFYT